MTIMLRHICKKCGQLVSGERCLPCRKEYLKAKCAEWYLANKDKVNAATKLYELSHPHRRDAWNEAHVEQRKTYIAEWAKMHRAERARTGAKYRATKLQATPAWANQFIIEEAYALAELRTQMFGFKWEVDHIVPLQHTLVCGLHVEHNLQVIPRSQNRQKSNHFTV